jgi:hypothetical protein
MSNGTRLSNFAGDKKECSVYLTIGYLSSQLRNMPSTHGIQMVALLPITIKNRNIPPKRFYEQWHTNEEVLNKVHWGALQPVTFKQNPSAECGYYNILYSDRIFMRHKPVSAAWLADCREDSDVYHLDRHVCFWSQCPMNELGDIVAPDKQHPRRDHNIYPMLSNANNKPADAELSSHQIQRGFIMFRQSPCNMSDLPNGDLLHKMHISMLDYLQIWIFHVRKTHKRLDKSNAI